jgi:hypothetical protein
MGRPKHSLTGRLKQKQMARLREREIEKRWVKPTDFGMGRLTEKGTN